MPRFFITQEQLDEGKINIFGEDAHHIARSLRMAVGEKITVCDGDGFEYDCEICEFESDIRVGCTVLSKSVCATEPPMKITLCAALTKGDKLDTVIQKSVECGACRIVPFESERCVVRAKADSEQRKTERRRKIAAEAAKQCGRGVLPTVLPTQSFSQMLEVAAESDIVLFCYEGEGTEPIGKILDRRLCAGTDGKYPSVAVIVGSEGGFDVSEVQIVRERGFLCVGLGKRILRAETAPIFAISCIVCRAELS